MFNPEGFSKEIFTLRYAFTEQETWEEACRRLARQDAAAELPEKQKEYEDKFFNILSDNLFVPGGRIWYNSGRINPQLLNCFVLTNELDSKQGWGNLAKEMIITSMAGGGCGVDFSDVRPNGATIAGQKGECPGPVSLMKLVDGCAKPVKAGGQRRVALMFSLDLDHPDVLEFLDAKLEKGELTHANVSVRSKRTSEFIKAVKSDGDWELSWKGQYKKKIKARELWDKIVKNAHSSAEPGFLNWELVAEENNISYVEDLVTTNPCQPSFATVLTPGGIKTIADVEKGSIIWSGKQWTKVTNKWSTGIKPVYKYNTSTGTFVGTENHRIIENGVKLEVKDAESIDWNTGPQTFVEELNPQDIMDGLIVGDGTVHKASNNKVFLIIGQNDQDYFNSEIGDLILKARPGVNKGSHEVSTTINSLELPKTFDRSVPDRFYFGNNKTKKGFLRGLFTANGSLSGGRVTLKQSSFILIKQVQEMLSSMGIHSYITTNRPKTIDWNNGSYTSKESYDLNITSGKELFRDCIGFIQKYKQEKISKGGLPKYLTSEIKEIEYLGEHEVFDLTVEAEEHTYWTGGCLVSNCGEIALSAYDCCCLGHLVLPRFLDGAELDWHKLASTVRLGVRYLDNILTVNYYPLHEMKQKSHKLRRIGLGTTGLADLLALLGYKYGSEEGNKFTEKLYKFIAKAAYEASVMLAVEKGPFPACDRKKHAETGFMRHMPKKIKSLVEEHGIRNCAILTLAPTGTVSILSGNCSSGIEPMFAPAYERRFWVGEKRKTELVFHPLFAEFMKEGKSVDHFVGSSDLKVEQHMEVQKVVQKWVDNAVSKTINMPNEYTIEDMSEMWLKYLPYLKGTTFYREGSRGFFNEKTGKVEEPPLKPIPIEEAKKYFTGQEKTDIIAVDNCSTGACEI